MNSREGVLAERVGNLFRQIEEARVASPTAEAWESLWTEELALEGDLINAANAVAQQGGIPDAIQLWEVVANLNDGLASIAAGLAERAAEGFDTEILAAEGQGAAATATGARAQSLLMASANQRLSGSPIEAAASAEAARQLFESLAESGQDSADTAASMALVAEGYRLAAIASTEQLRLQFADAALTYLQAKEVLDGACKRMRQAEDSTLAPLVAGLAADVSSFETAHRQALFQLAVNSGDFDDAVQQAEAIDTLLAAIVGLEDLPRVAGQLAELARSYNLGYLAYVRAEIAANGQDWTSAERQLVLAGNEWLRTVGLAVNTGLLQGRELAATTQALSAQVLSACRRRVTRERLLHATITKLEAENSVLQAEIYRLAARPTIKSEGGSVIMSEQQAGGDILGGNKTTAGGDVVTGDKVTAGGDANFTKLWQEHAGEIDLAALAKELKALRSDLESSANGEHDNEIAAVAAAELAASEGDGPGALKWLKSAGKWVLDHAVEIGAAVATAAAKAALGI